MTEEQKTLLIERYLKGALPDAERLEVERMIGADAQFAGDVSTMRLILDTLEDRELLQFHRRISDAWDAAGEEPRQETIPQRAPMRVVMIRRWLAAAGVALLFLAWFLIDKDVFSTRKRPEALNKYDTTYQAADFTTMGAGDAKRTEDLARFQDLFNQRKYREALPYIEPYSAPETEYQLYEGICRLRMEPPEADNAARIFAQMERSKSPYQTEGAWFLALSYAVQENWDSCAAVAARIPASWPRYPAAQELKNEAQKNTTSRQR